MIALKALTKPQIKLVREIAKKHGVKHCRTHVNGAAYVGRQCTPIVNAFALMEELETIGFAFLDKDLYNSLASKGHLFAMTVYARG